jgi:hypothetical protein
VLGTVEDVLEIGGEDLLLRGKLGCLLVGPHAQLLQPLLLQWLKLHAFEAFADDLYWRTLQVPT